MLYSKTLIGTLLYQHSRNKINAKIINMTFFILIAHCFLIVTKLIKYSTSVASASSNSAFSREKLPDRVIEIHLRVFAFLVLEYLRMFFPCERIALLIVLLWKGDCAFHPVTIVFTTYGAITIFRL